jgi:GNAT superfamily N-acetyltransferase
VESDCGQLSLCAADPDPETGGRGMSRAAQSDPAALALRYCDSTGDVAAGFPVMRELRPHLASEAEFTARWRRQEQVGYRLAGLWRGPTPVALAGFRLQENLIHGLHLYIDDLVTTAAERSHDHGEKLIAFVREEARRQGCSRLALDTALDNTLAHRFYYRTGLLATALRFSAPLN